MGAPLTGWSPCVGLDATRSNEPALRAWSTVQVTSVWAPKMRLAPPSRCGHRELRRDDREVRVGVVAGDLPGGAVL